MNDDRRPPAPAMPIPTSLTLQPILSLADETDAGIALQFLGDYLEMLPARLGRVLQGLHSGDPDISMDAILSLKIASAMAGATDPEAHCHRLEALVRAGQFDTALVNANALTASVHYLVNAADAVLEQAREHLLLDTKLVC